LVNVVLVNILRMQSVWPPFDNTVSDWLDVCFYQCVCVCGLLAAASSQNKFWELLLTSYGLKTEKMKMVWHFCLLKGLAVYCSGFEILFYLC